MEIIAVYGTTMVVMAMIFGLFMTWGVGANDLANAMGTSVCYSAPTVYFTKHRENWFWGIFLLLARFYPCCFNYCGNT